MGAMELKSYLVQVWTEAYELCNCNGQRIRARAVPLQTALIDAKTNTISCTEGFVAEAVLQDARYPIPILRHEVENAALRVLRHNMSLETEPVSRVVLVDAKEWEDRRITKAWAKEWGLE